MIDKYGLYEKDKEKIRLRYKFCVYCHKEMIYPYDSNNRKDSATIEHLNHLPPWNNPKTIAYCCASCNSSRGPKKIRDWFKTQYCIEKNIKISTVAKPVREYVLNIEDKL
ncbi:MAG TPA: hypothetical protein PKD85_01575 [Saprospiraceae bacterium]|nr:hypothetical protein [Saprospiraceae bacterium]